MDIRTAVNRTDPKVLQQWQARALVACAYMHKQFPHEATTLALILTAALGREDRIPPGTVRMRALGSDAQITKEGNVVSHKILKGVDLGVGVVCTISELNRGLGLILKMINATDAEYTLIVNKIASWISRDESTIGLHAEMMRETLNSDGTAKVP